MDCIYVRFLNLEKVSGLVSTDTSKHIGRTRIASGPPKLKFSLSKLALKLYDLTFQP